MTLVVGGEIRPHFRYLIFVGDNYYPSQALGDLVGSADTFKEAIAYALDKQQWGQWYQIIDKDTLDVLAKGDPKED